MLKVFGYPSYYHISEGKLEPRAKKGFFMGYGDGVMGFQVWSPSKRKVIMSIDVAFDECSMLHFKFGEDLGKVEDVTVQVEFESSTIRNISDQK